MISYEVKSNDDKFTLPSISLCTFNFSDLSQKEKYFAILDKYLEYDCNFIETARAYQNGISEQIIGEWMKARNNRKDVFLCTKGGFPDTEDILTSRLTKADLEYDLNESLKALQTDYIDLYLVNRDDEEIPVEDIMNTLNGFIKEGKVKFIGAGFWKTDRIEEANKYAKENGLVPFSISEVNYSLAHYDSEMFGDNGAVCMDLQSFNWYRDNQFPVLASSPQAKGFFSTIARGDSVKSLLQGTFVSTANLAKLAKVVKFCENGYTPATVTLGYLNSMPIPLSSVVGVDDVWQLEEDMQAGDLTFENKDIAFLENMR